MSETDELIPVFRPSYGADEFAAVKAVLESGWAGLGPATRRFEEAFALYVGSPHAVATSSCTAALHLAMHVLEVRGGEVISPSLTFVATNHAILYAGARPVFADVEPDTLTIDPADVERKITSRTRAITAMHYGGHPADMVSLRAIAGKRGIPILEDAAHACGASMNGEKTGTLGDIACFSFHAVKNLATGEGGMLTFADPGLDARLRRLRWMGIDRGTWDRVASGAGSTKGYAWEYGVEELGWKCHMNDIPAALGLAQLARLDAMNARRREIAALYKASFSGLPWIQMSVTRPGIISASHNFVVRVPEAVRGAFIDHLAGRNICAGMHYVPNHFYPIYGARDASLPVTEQVWKTLVTLPLFPDLTERQIGRVVDAVHAFRPGAMASIEERRTVHRAMPIAGS